MYEAKLGLLVTLRRNRGGTSSSLGLFSWSARTREPVCSAAFSAGFPSTTPFPANEARSPILAVSS